MKKIIIILFSILSIAIFAQIPESSYWYPNDILDWSPQTDSQAIYNVSHVPLARRVIGTPITDSASKDIKIMALSIMNPSTSGMPSQGSNNSFKAYPFTFWQYVDYLVAWAGSAGEGIIVPPSADIIDAAHKNGVYVLGTIFFPPNVYGGRRNWVDQLLRKENGKFVIADKLIEITKYYGFDGWFINQETNGCKDSHVKDMIDFLNYIKEKAPWMKLIWYDSMSNTGAIEWQGELNEKNVVFLKNSEKYISDAIFIDFRWQSLKRPETIENTLNTMKKYNISKDRVFVGFDLQANGYYTYSNWPKIIDNNGKLKVSLGFYCPSWTYYSSKEIKEFWDKEETFWIADHPVLNYNSKSEFFKIEWNKDYEQYKWQSPAKYVVEKSPVTSLPFITFFNVGHGYKFFIDGNVAKDSEWNNRSMMDVFPTYRWKIDGNDVNISVDYSDAYYGGSSLKFEGNLKKGQETNVTLYLTDLKINDKTTLESVIKGIGNIKVSLVLSYSDNTSKEFPLKFFNDWVKTIYNLENNNTISSISLKIAATEDTSYNFNLGMIGLIPIKNYDSYIGDVKIDNIEFKEGLYAQINLHCENSKAKYYEIYRILKNGERKLVWVSYNPYTYITQIKRDGKEKFTTLEVVGVSEGFTKSTPKKVTFQWPPYPKPKANFEVSNTIILPESTVTFKNLSSEVTEKVLWILPGATPNVSREWNPTVTYKEEGIYPAILVAMNSEGEDVKIFNPLIVVTEKAKEIKNLALNKKTYASSNVPSEKPSMAVDGTVENNSKWCAVGDLPHWIVIDFEKEVIISSVTIKHAEAGHESADWNTKDFRLQVSNDGINWKDVAIIRNNTKGVTTHSFAPVKARFFRLFIETPTQVGDKAARIYEIEVYGLESF
ncbi:endo-beta-N-acetylglucosaminidase D/PKD repeat protein [Thermosipho japonicus]|uniref:Endo-beta-N-acetylglucosaminidase D/PKD repeat protein n=1 Tax=Thermosipho japonicus TaxID=90323 RepID=A0A841GSL8_9BACT|nr:discoidin domain-containing protein [Thermosipho japonicus]MBB6062170.1 endo-beta-N-acetylglucosaminidase D/PKD repeat protein [Thermosipho japonicus]